MKIAILNTLYYPYKVGGAEVSVQLLAESLVAEGHDVYVITLKQGGVEEITQYNGVVIYRLPLRNLYWPFDQKNRNALQRLAWHIIDNYNIFSKKDIAKALERIKPDVLHTNNLGGFSVSAWDAAYALSIPVVHTSRDYYLIHPNSKLYTNKGVQDASSLTCKAWSFIKKHKSRKVSKYVAISDYVRGVHNQAGFFRENGSTIYNSIEMPDLPTLGHSKPADNALVFGYIGRIDPSKGLDVMLAAFKELGGAHKLLIAGAGRKEYIEQLKRIADSDSITWLGHVAPADFYSNIDCLIVPSLWPEPLGRVVLEAYSYGKPVIGANSGGIPEIIQHGVTGLTYVSNSKEYLLEALSGFSKNQNSFKQDACIMYARKFEKRFIAKSYSRRYAEAQS